MRKVIYILTLLLVAASANAQKIVDDRVTDSGLRLISCESKPFRSMTDKVVMSLGLSASVKDDDVNYFLDVTLASNSPLSAPAGARMLIKTTNGDVITLTEFSNKTLEDNIGNVKNVGGTIIKTFTLNCAYLLTPEQIQQLLSGITKIRIELNGDANYEKEWKKDKISDFLSKEYKLLTEAVATDKKGGFADDF
ncbi:MAG: hypothetical protein NC548_46680 [Lachnospiraceae bacterium]|nr:hypothetical protein [Lachnospiraceae bacterium]